jgi:hypothetical protein
VTKDAPPAARLRGQAASLLGARAAAGPAERRVAIGDRELTASMVAATAAFEITVHGWDIWVACGARRPVPPVLTAVLLPIAPLLITPATRPGCSPTRYGCPARPAPVTSWSPSAAASRAPRSFAGQKAERHRPARGDSRASRWSIFGRPPSRRRAPEQGDKRDDGSQGCRP